MLPKTLIDFVLDGLLTQEAAEKRAEQKYGIHKEQFRGILKKASQHATALRRGQKSTGGVLFLRIGALYNFTFYPYEMLDQLIQNNYTLIMWKRIHSNFIWGGKM